MAPSLNFSRTASSALATSLPTGPKRAEEVALDNLADLDEIMSADALLHKSCRRVSLLLIARGSLTFWFDENVAAWRNADPHKGPGEAGIPHRPPVTRCRGSRACSDPTYRPDDSTINGSRPSSSVRC